MKTCPVCTLELEDSYLFCPEDGASLTAVDSPSTAFAGTQSNEDTTNVVLYQNMPTDNFDPGLGSNVATVSNSAANKEIIEHCEGVVEPSTFSLPGPRIQPPAFSSEALEADQTGLRIAAIATIIALAVFGLVGIYALVSNLSRRPSQAARPAGQNETAQEVPFIVTPQAAQDSRDASKDADTPKQSAASGSGKAADVQATTRVVERERKETPSSSNGERNRTAPDTRSIQRMPSQATRVSTTGAQAPDPPALLSSHTSSREFDSRLVRARSSRISAGYRYDLTFNMQEQLGHSTQWQRVLITTRSASGASHTQAIPFVHRLGATGALTFTISVELTGRSEANWRGRINCTTLGWDNTGAPLQASFVANVTP